MLSFQCHSVIVAGKLQQLITQEMPNIGVIMAVYNFKCTCTSRTRNSEEASKTPVAGVWLLTRFVLFMRVYGSYIYILCDCSS